MSDPYTEVLAKLNLQAKVPPPYIDLAGSQGAQIGDHNLMINHYATHDIAKARSLPPPPRRGAPDRTAECPLTRMPRTEEEENVLLEFYPKGWEYLYYGARLFAKREAIAPKWRDHQVGYARHTGEWLDSTQAHALFTLCFRAISGIVSNVMTALDGQVLEAAFGRPGEPGDPFIIDRTASYLVDSAEQMMDWSARLRGATVPAAWQQAFRLASDTSTRPMAETFEFIEKYIASCDKIIQWWQSPSGTPLHVTHTLKLTADKKLLNKCLAECRRAVRKR